MPAPGMLRMRPECGPCSVRVWSVCGACAASDSMQSGERRGEGRGEKTDALAAKIVRQGHYGILRGSEPAKIRVGAGDGIRTRDIDLGKVALYQLSYSRPLENPIFSRNRGGVKRSE